MRKLTKMIYTCSSEDIIRKYISMTLFPGKHRYSLAFSYSMEPNSTDFYFKLNYLPNQNHYLGQKAIMMTKGRQSDKNGSSSSYM